MRGSQNGYDNSGQAQDILWDTSQSPKYTSFNHWSFRAAHWAGVYDLNSGTYLYINHTNIDFSLSVVEEVVLKYKDNPNVVGIEPANEPWANIPIDVVKHYYWDSYNIVRLQSFHSLSPSLYIHIYIYMNVFARYTLQETRTTVDHTLS